jgi:radical SAM protein with 4Fe4S-binding SPASM domain
VVTISSKENLDELVEIFHLARSLGVDSFNILGLEPYTVTMSNRILYGEIIRPEYRNVFSALKKLARKHRIKMRLPSLRSKPHKTCDLRGCIIDSNGEIYPCATLSYERPFYYLGEKFIHPGISFGNVLEKDFFDIWNSSEYKTFRRNLLHGKLPGFCQKCLMKHRVICPI